MRNVQSSKATVLFCFLIKSHLLLFSDQSLTYKKSNLKRSYIRNGEFSSDDLQQYTNMILNILT